jgi:hypothetical protein
MTRGERVPPYSFAVHVHADRPLGARAGPLHRRHGRAPGRGRTRRLKAPSPFSVDLRWVDIPGQERAFFTSAKEAWQHAGEAAY